tara:strand:- start:8996 stop:9427 length:432 start_codon:yes stop_codon:yes gene_type:complete
MATSLYDSVDDIKDLIETKWNTGSTDGGIMPRVVRIWDEKTIGFGNSREAIILLEPKREDIDYFNLYGTDFLHEITIRLDIRTYLSAYNHDITVSELIRIIKDNLRRDGYVDLRITASEPLSHLYRNMFRHAIEISYRKINPS